MRGLFDYLSCFMDILNCCWYLSNFNCEESNFSLCLLSLVNFALSEQILFLAHKCTIRHTKKINTTHNTLLRYRSHEIRKKHTGSFYSLLSISTVTSSSSTTGASSDGPSIVSGSCVLVSWLGEAAAAAAEAEVVVGLSLRALVITGPAVLPAEYVMIMKKV